MTGIILKNNNSNNSSSWSSSPLLRPSAASTLVTSTDSLWLQLVRPLAKPSSVPGREKVTIVTVFDRPLLDKILGTKPLLLACDLETRGLNPREEGNDIVGVGLASTNGRAVYFDFRESEQLDRQAVFDYISELSEAGTEFVGHNVFFDSQWLLHHSGKKMNWRWDTFGLYRQLATEGYNNLRFGLKDAQTDLLKWQHRGDEELEEWLCANGYYKGAQRKEHGDSAALLELCRAGSLKANKGEMWRAPVDILGYYCGLDCISTIELLTKVFIPSVEALPVDVAQSFFNYHDLFLTNLEALVEARLDGFRIDTDQLDTYWQWIQQETVAAKQAFFSDPQVAAFVTRFNEERLAAFEAETEPSKYKKPPVLGAEPPRLKKDGEISKAWLSWDEKRQRVANWEIQENISKAWLNWAHKRDRLAEKGAFNVDSGVHRRVLFYEELKYQPKVWTETGQPAVDKKALKHFGEHGKLLKRYNDLIKEQQMAQSCLNVMLPDDATKTYRVHPSFKAPGTFTGRLAGADKLNIQQLPKRREYLQCWVADEGYSMVDADWSSLELVVLAGLSRDDSMMKLYGPNSVGVPLTDLIKQLDKLGIRYVIQNGEIEINDEDLYKL